MGDHHGDLTIISRDGEGGEMIRDQSQELRLFIRSRLDLLGTRLQQEPEGDNRGDETVVVRASVAYMDSSSGGSCMEEHQVNNRGSPPIVGEVSGDPYVPQLYFQSQLDCSSVELFCLA